jgi:CheY-like chemotaxis protein
MINFSSGQLTNTLEKLEQNSFNGMAEIIVDNLQSKKTWTKIFVFRKGKLVLADDKLVTPQELAIKIARELNISIIDAALKTANTKVNNPSSFQEVFAFLIRMKIISPQQIEAFVLQNIVVSLEQLLLYSGNLKTNPEINIDLTYENHENGWSLAELMAKLTERKQQWQKFSVVGITSAESVPRLGFSGLKKISSIPAQKHCETWINGQRSIAEIAEKTHQDPLQLAKNYYLWSNQNWIHFAELALTIESEKPETLAKPTPESKLELALPTILSVDDSPVVQTMLKRALSDRYEVILANNGMDALKVLNSSKQDIQLVLLDVTMPDIDGIELCRTIRRFKKFQDLPIIMLTAKDGMFDKVKGKFAGSTEYLTKPVDKETLLATIAKYVSFLTIG